MSALTQIRHRFQRFGPEQASGPFGSPLYVALCAGLAADPETASLLLEAAPVQRIPNLLLAAVHDLLLSGGEAGRHPLARYYPSVAGESVPPDDLTYATFRAFCAAYREEILVRVRGRSTQTNEPRRAAVLFPALGMVAGESGRPLALLEPGASAGLLLQPDRYGYDYEVAHGGDRSSPLQLRCELLPSLEPPIPAQVSVAWRAGIDLAPVDVHDAKAVRWLAACLWPEHRQRAEDLSRAVALARVDPPRVVRGDLVDSLAALIAEAPVELALLVMHATALLYLTAARRRAFGEVVAGAARRHQRTVWMVSFEAIEILATMDGELLRGLPDERPAGPSAAVALSTFEPDGSSAHRLLALAHPHGRWLRWLAASSAVPSGWYAPRIGFDV
jgi:hypothetical protein